MRLPAIYPLLLASQALAQSTLLGTESITTTSSGTALGDVAETTSLTYLSLTSTITVASLATANATNATTTSSNHVTVLGGSTSTAANSTNAISGTKTSSSALPTNTQPCNGWPEFCQRKYSNITMVTAHNFCFTKANNAARNQELGVTDQLNDGIRMLQAQAHWQNDTLYFCHTSCDLLNAGTVESQLAEIVSWLDANPYEVVTLLLGNYDLTTVQNFVPAIQNSGLRKYAYEPPYIPMSLDNWPTLGELILTGKRALIFMDYNANQTAVPYIMDEFSQMWETPFSPTDVAFPCTAQRPPGMSTNDKETRLYLANHNLNVDISYLGVNILVPNTVGINQTNAVSGNGSLGEMASTCVGDWGRPPNFLLVDFYDKGNVPGSVFEVAATWNNVTYSRKCCGNSSSDAGARLLGFAHLIASVGVVMLSFWL